MIKGLAKWAIRKVQARRIKTLRKTDKRAARIARLSKPKDWNKKSFPEF